MHVFVSERRSPHKCVEPRRHQRASVTASRMKGAQKKEDAGRRSKGGGGGKKPKAETPGKIKVWSVCGAA